MAEEPSNGELTDIEVGNEPGEESVGEPAEPPFEDFGSGQLLRGSDLLTAREASRALAKGEGRVIIWAGERRSGKTTLTVELYERHRVGRAITMFAGSQTLLGFEERVHPARAASGRVMPHTPRTETDPDGRDLLHLAVRAPDGEHSHLLFADLPGELFRRIRDNDLSATDVPLLQRADKLAILVDGDRLADPARRSTVVSNARQLIERLSTGGLPNPRTETMLLATKLDKIVVAGDGALEYWEPREEDLLRRLRELDPMAQVLRTSAREGSDPDDGMDELMRWLLEAPHELPDPPLPRISEAPGRLQRIRQPKGLR